MTGRLFSRARGGLAAAAFVMAVAAADPLWPLPQGGPGALQAILAEARRTTRLIDGQVKVRQLYELHAFGRRWRFDAQVTKDDRSVVVEVRGAPWFIPPRLELALVEAFDLLEGYDPVLAGSDQAPSGQPVWVIEAWPRPDRPGGARRVRFWVEKETGRVTHLELAYWWGSLVIDQAYQRLGPYTVLDRQHVTIQPLGIRVDVRYRDYRFGPSEAAWPAASSSTSEKMAE